MSGTSDEPRSASTTTRYSKNAMEAVCQELYSTKMNYVTNNNELLLSNTAPAHIDSLNIPAQAGRPPLSLDGDPKRRVSFHKGLKSSQPRNACAHSSAKAPVTLANSGTLNNELGRQT